MGDLRESYRRGMSDGRSGKESLGTAGLGHRGNKKLVSTAYSAGAKAGAGYRPTMRRKKQIHASKVAAMKGGSGGGIKHRPAGSPRGGQFF